ncbi:MAG: polysaccharide pyruvyl transferase family protein [Negativicutes bacterium]|nr:polysaccharide pyruvyl transferase family protein [Negativicutes bacterium]
MSRRCRCGSNSQETTSHGGVKPRANWKRSVSFIGERITRMRSGVQGPYPLETARNHKIVPNKIREMYGVVLDRDVDVVLDASGFAYSDQWGGNSCRELVQSCKRWRRNGTKIILMPQAFGKFNSKKNKKWIKEAVELVDLIFPRDEMSHQYLIDVVGHHKNINIAPDFTNILDGILPDNFDIKNNRFCIVPNFRMIDKTQKEHGENYIPFMADCVQYLVEKGSKPFLLIHEGEDDFMLAHKISEKVTHNIPIVQEDHPLKIKGIIGACDGTIGSRFHGLVSALSQGVPSLATGWSHKYKMLFKDYNFEDCFLDINENKTFTREKIDLLTDKENFSQIKSKLISRSKELKEKTRAMWSHVYEVIDYDCRVKSNS